MLYFPRRRLRTTLGRTRRLPWVAAESADAVARAAANKAKDSSSADMARATGRIADAAEKAAEGMRSG
jgi:hypothetical protein